MSLPATITDHTTNDDSLSIERREPKSLDDYYIECYLEDPTNKTYAYIKANDLVGKIVSETYARQYAHALHRRLSERINQELQVLTLDDKAFGRHITRKLALDAQSEAVQANCAKTLTGSHYTGRDESNQAIEVHINRDNIEITHKNQTLKIEGK